MGVFHSNTQRLIDHWSGLRSPGRAPARADFDPAALANLLPQTFMLSRTAGLPFRLAGALIEDLHDRPLRGTNFMDLWSADGRAAIRDAAVSSMRGCEPVILYAEGLTRTDRRAGLELMLAPMTGQAGRIDRMIGLCQPISTLVRLHGDAIVELGHRLTVYAGSDANGPPVPHLKLAAVDGRRIA